MASDDAAPKLGDLQHDGDDSVASGLTCHTTFSAASTGAVDSNDASGDDASGTSHDASNDHNERRTGDDDGAGSVRSSLGDADAERTASAGPSSMIHELMEDLQSSTLPLDVLDALEGFVYGTPRMNTEYLRKVVHKEGARVCAGYTLGTGTDFDLSQCDGEVRFYPGTVRRQHGDDVALLYDIEYDDKDTQDSVPAHYVMDEQDYNISSKLDNKFVGVENICDKSSEDEHDRIVGWYEATVFTEHDQTRCKYRGASLLGECTHS